MIGKLEVSGRQKRFDWDVDAHDHIFCVRCHRVDDLHMKRKQLGIEVPETVGGYRITGYRLEIAGLCKQCRSKLKEEKEK
jgi:Fur family ferric uptake transcriptional regulator